MARHLRDAISRLSFISGVALGLAPKDRRAEILKLATDTMAFVHEVDIKLRKDHKA